MAKRKKSKKHYGKRKRSISGFSMKGLNLVNIAGEAGGAIVAEMAIAKIPFPSGKFIGDFSYDAVAGVKAVAAGVAIGALFPKSEVARRAAIVARGVGYASILRGVGVVSGILDNPLQGIDNLPAIDFNTRILPGNDVEGTPLQGVDMEEAYI